MSRQLLLCVESNSRSRTDFVYIKSTIDNFYLNDKKTIIRPIFLDTKTKYKDNGKIKEIKKKIKEFKGKTEVIYFIDYDNSDTSFVTQKLFFEIKDYCNKEGYEFVYFYMDIEDVYWGEKVNDNEKVKKASDFKRLQMINYLKESKLMVSDYKRHCSNILIVLDKFLDRKTS